MEKWAKIDGFKNYLISNHGRVKSISRKTKHSDGKITTHKERFLKLAPNKKGYLCVRINEGAKKKTLKPHRLVALAFIPNMENKPQVNHKDGNKNNNNESNLEWVTNLENMQHCNKLGLNPHVFVKGQIPHNKK